MGDTQNMIEFYPGQVTGASLEDSIWTLVTNNEVILQVYIITNDILRFRYTPNGYFPKDFSYGIDPSYESSQAQINLDEDDHFFILSTSTVVCKVQKSDMRVSLFDKEGNLLNEDEKGFHWEENKEHGGYIVQMTKKLQSKEAFYGLGDKPTDLNLKGKRFENWGTDQYGYQKNTDPLYKNIPIYYGLHNDIAYGIFFDNSFRSYFDFGKERPSVCSFWAQGGEMNYYFIAGPTLMDACIKYTKLTGTPEMPPLWALGFQQCKWSYYPEAKVKEIASTMREKRIPCDAIYLDIDYMDGFRCFTWDKEKFPNPKRMVKELSDDGFKTMVIIDPGIKIDMQYDVFREGLEKGYYCRRPDGPFIKGKVWPDDCYFPDFTNPEVREWWAGLYKGLIEDVGIAGIWNDMNEPAVFEVESKTFPLDVMHDYDGHLSSHRKAHNVYGMQMARATQEGVRRFAGEKRSLIITRSGYSGLQRYSSVWTGDNIASWEHLWLAGVQVQRLAISGISFAGSDIGGFVEDPSGEMMVRWIQLAIFHPFCRVHSSGEHGDQEPWVFGEEYTQLFREAVELRYQILPYLYTQFFKYHTEGIPMVSPLVFHDQTDEETYNRDHEFLCGPDMLIAPVVNGDAQSRKMYLPTGNWYNYWNKQIHEGKNYLTVPFESNNFPFFIKEGAIIPRYPVQQYVGEKNIDKLYLDYYFKNGTSQSSVYDDDSESYNYENGEYRLSNFSIKGNEKELVISQEIKGPYVSKITTYQLQLIGLPFMISKMIVDDVEIAISDIITIPANFKKCVFS